MRIVVASAVRIEMQGIPTCGVDQFKGSWERVSVTVHSGADNSVMPKRIATGIPIRQTESSRQGLKHRAANGTSIKNEGERTLRGYIAEASLVDMSILHMAIAKERIDIINLILQKA